MNIVNIRFLSGENCICELVEETDTELTLKDVIVAMPINEEGTQLGFAPWAPLQDPDVDEIKVKRDHVLYITKPAPNLTEQYAKMFSKIVTPSKKIIV